MFGRTRPSRPPEDPAVAQVERILQKAARYHAAEQPTKERRSATQALWICACVTMDDAPTWLIYDTDDDGIAWWCRVPHEVEPLDLVDARLSAGGHADPGQVLLWLQGKAPEPWAGGGGGSGDAGVLEELGRKIRRT